MPTENPAGPRRSYSVANDVWAPFEADEGLSLVVDFGQRPLRVVAAYRGAPPPGHHLPHSVAMEEDGADLPPARQQRFVSLHDEDGECLTAFKLPQGATSFLDGRDGGSGRPTGGLAAGRDCHLLHLPCTREMKVLGFCDTAYRPEGARASSVRNRMLLAGAFTFPGVEKVPDRLRFPDGAEIALPKDVPALEEESPPGGGDSVEVVHIHGERPPHEAFNIVVLGDGYTEVELPALEARAREFAARLLGSSEDPTAPGIAPFSKPELRERISIDLIKAASEDHGVTFCPGCTQERNTFFKVRGNFTGSGMPTDYDTDDLVGLYSAVTAVADLAHIEAILVIPNCAQYGGRGFRDRRLAFASALPSMENFTHLAIHELAHAVADLGDEYRSCDVERDVPRIFRNIATPSQLAAGPPWWIRLAEAHEIEGGELRVQHRCQGPVPTGADANALGMFWGAQFIEAAASPCECDHQNDQRLCGYFRPMRRCKMRRIRHDFCRVCQHVLEEAIRAVAP